eukprot:scaffold107515_cov14-Tisochrysis_lutea.AAC.1
MQNTAGAGRPLCANLLKSLHAEASQSKRMTARLKREGGNRTKMFSHLCFSSADVHIIFMQQPSPKARLLRLWTLHATRSKPAEEKPPLQVRVTGGVTPDLDGASLGQPDTSTPTKHSGSTLSRTESKVAMMQLLVRQ